MRISVSRICQNFGVTRQGFYKEQKRRMVRFIQRDRILQATRQLRTSQPRVGGKKIYRMLPQMGLQIGRDHLFKLLRENRLLIRPKKNYRKTTNSFHRFRKHSNLIKELKVNGPNQVFVSDITYLDTQEGFCYLALVTDLYSRNIVGWNVSKNLSVEGCLKALRMALSRVGNPEKLIHHSDRGFQYCCARYTNILQSHGIKISMTEENHVYENAVAERVNGILKSEFLLGERLPSFQHACQLAGQSIKTYNEQRLHTSLDYKTPAECYAV
jgi:putative transposase